MENENEDKVAITCMLCSGILAVIALWVLVTTKSGFATWDQSDFDKTLYILAIVFGLVFIRIIYWFTQYQPLFGVLVTAIVLGAALADHYEWLRYTQESYNLAYRSANLLVCTGILLFGVLVTVAIWAMFFRDSASKEEA